MPSKFLDKKFLDLKKKIDNLDKNNKCTAPCLLLDEKCNTTKDPLSLTPDKNNINKCRSVSKPL